MEDVTRRSIRADVRSLSALSVLCLLQAFRELLDQHRRADVNGCWESAAFRFLLSAEE